MKRYLESQGSHHWLEKEPQSASPGSLAITAMWQVHVLYRQHQKRKFEVVPFWERSNDIRTLHIMALVPISLPKIHHFSVSILERLIEIDGLTSLRAGVYVLWTLENSPRLKWNICYCNVFWHILILSLARGFQNLKGSQLRHQLPRIPLLPVPRVSCR